MSTGLNLLSKILQDNRLEEFLRVSKDALYQEDEHKLYAKMKKHYDTYSLLPTWELATSKYKLKPVPEEPFQYYWDEYINRYLYNQVGDFLPEAQDILRGKKPDKVIGKMRDFLTQLEAKQAVGRRDVVQMADLGDMVLDFVQSARTKNGITGTVTGWDKLDVITNGLQKGDLYVILARPKLGKSLVIARMAHYAHLAGEIPILVSMEMRALQMARRFFALRAGMNMDYLKTGEISTFAVRRIQHTINLMREQQPFYYVEGQFRKSVQELQALIHAVRPTVVYIDGGYLLKLLGAGARLQKWERVTEIAERLKEISIKMDIPVVVSFQFNRQVKKSDQSAGYENIQLADAIAQLASVGIGIFDDDAGSMFGRCKRIEIIGEGGREGESGGFWINWLWDSMNFDEMIEDEGERCISTN